VLFPDRAKCYVFTYLGDRPHAAGIPVEIGVWINLAIFFMPAAIKGLLGLEQQV